MTTRLTYFVLPLLVACSDSNSSSDVLGGSLTVTGTVHDFESGAQVMGAASVSTTALSPTPKVTVEGAAFTIDGVPENSAFQVLASVPTSHRPTYSQVIEVVSDDVDGVSVKTVSEQFLGTLATGFGVTPSAAKGVLLLHLVDGAGAGKAGVAAANLVLANAAGATGPKFLDANMAPAPAATASTSSGWAVFFEVPPGTIALGQAATATVTLEMASSPVGSGAVTIADVKVTDGAPPATPTNVSFSQQVFPIFTNRGCVACHTGSGPGKDLGGLMLDGGSNLAYKELTVENPLRANTATPEKSLMLTMPSAESPPDGHPNVTFTGPSDPDYIKILVWIREGAKSN
ncbi:MAG TPA: hypothetical protein VFV99_02015 [Kofleriaceae bacterium]|nr:hypothetical protein [Kofleriaceae bacterium]